jgi:hypothetical protein
MKNKKSFLIALLSLGLLYFFSGCKKENASLPQCIALKIQQIKQEPKRNPPAEIWQYCFQERTVYYIPPFCCDQYSVLLDEDCRVICAPDGGLSGKGDGGCPDFFSRRTNGILIWRDER